MSFTQLGMLGDVALAMLLGGLIGLEREFKDKPAGFRTLMLVAGAAALLVGLGDSLLERFGGSEFVRSDPIRIVEAIITGISFLGAGTIFRRSRDEQVEGLTTAAAILLSAAIGISVALHQFTLAVGVTALSLLVLYGLTFLEKWLVRKREKGTN